MSIYDANKDKVRYRYVVYKKDTNKNRSIFYIGTNIMKDVGFNIKDKIMIIPEEGNFILKKDIFGKILRWKTSRVQSNFAEIIYYESMRKSLGLRKSRSLVTLAHEIRLDPHDPQNNQLVVTFK